MNDKKIKIKKIILILLAAAAVIYLSFSIACAISTLFSNKLSEDLSRGVPELRQDKYKLTAGGLRGCQFYLFERCEVVNVSSEVMQDENTFKIVLNVFYSHRSEHKLIMNIMQYNSSNTSKLILQIIKPIYKTPQQFI